MAEEIKFDDDLETGYQCVDCFAPMLVKTNRKTGHQFLGCSNFPDCDNTRPIPDRMYLKAAGQEELF